MIIRCHKCKNEFEAVCECISEYRCPFCYKAEARNVDKFLKEFDHVREKKFKQDSKKS